MLSADVVASPGLQRVGSELVELFQGGQSTGVDFSP